MHFLSNTTWASVFAAWQREEGSDPAWQAFAREKGFATWADWRGSAAAKLGVTSLDWQLFAFDNPQTEIPTLLLGPMKSWQSRVHNIEGATFNDLLTIPAEFDHWSTHPKILSIIANWPTPTQLIAVHALDTGHLICLEGHHRATAVALANRLGRAINFGEITIAIARVPFLHNQHRVLTNS